MRLYSRKTMVITTSVIFLSLLEQNSLAQTSSEQPSSAKFEAQLRLGQNEVLAKQTAKGIKDFDKIVNDSDDFAKLSKAQIATLFDWRGYAYLVSKDYNNCIADATRAMEALPNDAYARLNRGSAECLLERYDEGVADLSAAIFRQFGPQTYDNEDLNRVMVCCSKAIIAKKPIHNKKALTTLITAFSVRAFAHEALSQPAESANDLSEAILLSTSSNTKRNSKAMAESASFLQSLYLRSAKVNLAMGQIKDAQRDCDVAEKLSPNRLNEICKIRNDALLRTSGDTPIQGVNTAGTFHAGNLANLEALLNISCWFMQFLGYGLAIVFLLDLIRTSPIHVQKRRRLLLRFALSVLFAATISHMVNFLICDARDVNLFY